MRYLNSLDINGKGLCAKPNSVPTGQDVVFFFTFTAALTSRGVDINVVHVASVIGPQQFAAELEVAEARA